MATSAETKVTTNSDQSVGSENPVIPEKHPLQNRWSLWYYKSDKSKEWKDNLKTVISFDSVEDFWSVFNHIKPPSQIVSGCDYMLFKEGIEPMWEDIRNKAGGRWLLNLEKKDRRENLDSSWLETLLLLIGEGFDDSSDEVCGAVVQIRNKGDKIAIWTANSKKKDDIMHIGRTYKERILMHRRNAAICYQSHVDVSGKSGSISKSIFNI